MKGIGVKQHGAVVGDDGCAALIAVGEGRVVLAHERSWVGEAVASHRRADLIIGRVRLGAVGTRLLTCEAVVELLDDDSCRREKVEEAPAIRKQRHQTRGQHIVECVK